MTDELDLNNKEVVDQLIERDILQRKPDKELEEVETAIKEVNKLQKFTVKLTGYQAAQLLREASQLGKSTKDYFQELVEEKCFTNRIGTPVIRRVSEHTMNVVGPSAKSLVTRA